MERYSKGQKNKVEKCSNRREIVSDMLSHKGPLAGLLLTAWVIIIRLFMRRNFERGRFHGLIEPEMTPGTEWRVLWLKIFGWNDFSVQELSKNRLKNVFIANKWVYSMPHIICGICWIMKLFDPKMLPALDIAHLSLQSKLRNLMSWPQIVG